MAKIYKLVNGQGDLIINLILLKVVFNLIFNIYKFTDKAYVNSSSATVEDLLTTSVSLLQYFIIIRKDAKSCSTIITISLTFLL